jgi:putative SOS response-associated peptidase YedK
VQVDVDIKKLAKKFNAKVHTSLGHESIKSTPLGPSKKDYLPVLVREDNQIIIKSMLWSLTPSWSKEFPCKWSTYNARMERAHQGKKQKIYDVPSFKNSFRKNQFCLVPIRGAIEACYWGEKAGHILAFQKADGENYYVVGIWDEWKRPEESIQSFSLLTDGPYPYFFQMGHDRSIISIDEKNIQQLMDTETDYQKTYSKIKKLRIAHKWNYEPIRAMKTGWEKKAPDAVELQEIQESIWEH